MPTVAVVYLARTAHGIDSFKPFAESYLKFPAGYDHELILLGKGMAKKGERAATSALFGDAQHRIIAMPEDGYDIHAYLKAARILHHDFVLFCNTYTEFVSDNWLAKMMEYAVRPNVGIVGATASYESIYSSTKLYHKLLWLAGTKRIRYDASVATQYSSFLGLHHRAWMAAHYSTKARIRRLVGDILKHRPRYSLRLVEEFERIWHVMTEPGTPLHKIRNFSHFPNPHIRSTVFLMSRERLVNLNFRVGGTKEDCANFESGIDGLSNRIQQRGLELILVGADGIGYTVEEWPQSNTFRLGDEGNCLTTDNHISAFKAFDPATRELHSRISWGDYLNSKNPFQAVGESFAKTDLNRSSSVLHSADKEDESVSYSIVIPTHNRLALVKDAIETVRQQSYQNWELVVFDNASTEPVKEHIESLNDPRIRFKRSDKFLAVTDSWNNAIDLATGDYVMLIGDDDGLKPGFFQRLNRLNFQFKNPDVIYSSILQFFHPGVAPWKREGYVSEVRNGFFFLGHEQPFILDAATRRKAVENSLNIRRGFTFNMQAFIFKRDFLNKMRLDGKIFRSPFPDYYLANVVFAMADTVVANPESLAIAGVSRASFGFTLFNKLEKKGAELLKTDFDSDFAYKELKDSLLPGPAYNSSYIMTMLHVCQRLGNWTTIRPDVDRYRRMQVLALIPGDAKGLSWTKTEPGAIAWSKLTLREKLWAIRLSLGNRRKDGFFAKEKANLDPTWFSPIAIPKNEGDFASTMDLFDALERQELDIKVESRERRVKLRRPIRSLRNKYRRAA